MAFMQISSTNPKFSMIMCKNPASGMIAKRIRKGVAYGFYSKGREDQYNIFFQDDYDEISFSKYTNQEFEYLDSTRYSSPLFVFSAVKEFATSALKKQLEDDKEGFENVIRIASFHSKKFDLLEHLFEYFPDYHVTTHPVGALDYALTIKTSKSIYELLNFTYMISLMAAAMSDLNLVMDEGLISRAVAAMNICQAPYYVRYIARLKLCTSKSLFLKVKDDLEKVPGHKVEFSDSITNLASRMEEVVKSLPKDLDIVDVGCGEGNFLHLATTIGDHTYHAIDIDPDAIDHIQKRAAKKKIENLACYNNVDEFIEISKELNSKYVVMMNEVIEHQEKDQVASFVDKFILDPNCVCLIITTPNRDFNKNYLLKEGELRHPDHKFEFTGKECVDFFSNRIWHGYLGEQKQEQIGDKVDDIGTTLMITLTKPSLLSKQEGENK